MKSICRAVLALAVVLGFASNASALTQAPKAAVQYLCNDGATEGPYAGDWTQNICRSYNPIDGESLNASADELTITTEVSGYAKVNMTAVVVDADASSTPLNITCAGSLDNGTSYGLEQSKSVTAGIATLSDYIERKAVGSGTTSILTQFGVKGYTHFRCVYSAGGTAGDTDFLTVNWSKSVGD